MLSTGAKVGFGGWIVVGAVVNAIGVTIKVFGEGTADDATCAVVAEAGAEAGAAGGGAAGDDFGGMVTAAG